MSKKQSMFCPLSFAGGYWNECKKENCAVWDKTSKKCSFLNISESLQVVADQVANCGFK